MHRGNVPCRAGPPFPSKPHSERSLAISFTARLGPRPQAASSQQVTCAGATQRLHVNTRSSSLLNALGRSCFYRRPARAQQTKTIYSCLSASRLTAALSHSHRTRTQPHSHPHPYAIPAVLTRRLHRLLLNPRPAHQSSGGQTETSSHPQCETSRTSVSPVLIA
jgi:hypothetical protein